MRSRDLLAVSSYGKFTFEVQSPVVPGVIVAATLIAPGGDEIDIEMLGGDPRHWQVWPGNLLTEHLH
jgi:hypothetical protein